LHESPAKPHGLGAAGETRFVVDLDEDSAERGFAKKKP
jgi:hypothetical protein